MRSIPNLSCCQLLLLFFAAFFSWVLFPRSFICYCWPVTFCEVCETRIFGKNITSEKCLTVSSFIIPNETEYDDAWKFFHVRNVQFMQNFQYITTVNQCQLLLLFFAAFFSWVLFPRSFISYFILFYFLFPIFLSFISFISYLYFPRSFISPLTFCEICETRIFGKNIQSRQTANYLSC